MFIQEEVNNLEKALKILQFPVKTTPFYLPPQYKILCMVNKMNNIEKKLLWNLSSKGITLI